MGSGDADALIGDASTVGEPNVTRSVPDAKETLPEAGWIVDVSDGETTDALIADRQWSSFVEPKSDGRARQMRL
jgi:hypothetical protein